VRSLTTLRGGAALWVILFHLDDAFREFVPELRSLDPLFRTGWLAVPLFFVLSGYVLGINYLGRFARPTGESVARFWTLRLGRIYPVHAAMLGASVLVFARHGWGPPGGGLSKEAFVKNVFLVQAWSRVPSLSWNWPSWSISAEWFAYLLFPALAVGFARISRTATAVVATVACAASAYVYTTNDWPYRPLVQVVPTFVTGVALSILFPGDRLRSPLARRAPLALVVACGLWPFLMQHEAARNAGFLILFTALVALLGGAGHASAPFWSWRPLGFLGDVSYSAYMTHAMTIDLALHFAPPDRLASSGTPVRVAAMVALIALVYLVATGMYYGVERPCRDFSRRLLAQRASPRPSAI
jgi:peptidoglycan/LPS O-acetylase OafA/YrhL